MRIRAVGFDIGQTLVKYKSPLSWKIHYPDALRKVMQDCQIGEDAGKLDLAAAILSKYNTRENYREHEVSSDIIFKEIFDAWGQTHEKLHIAKEAFYGFFQANVAYFDDTTSTLELLSSKGILLGFLSDVAYGMDNEYVLKDIEEVKHYFDVGFTSTDVGFRKPNPQGFKMLSEAFGVPPSQILFVGDEEKDIVGANNFGMISALINKSPNERKWGQHYTIQNLSEIVTAII
ncbi:MAG: HAD family hydrolase [Defluviitaleaceae bacterium]|nr:HAD family hydrolase [Defluviitaleaceae bacterium]